MLGTRAKYTIEFIKHPEVSSLFSYRIDVSIGSKTNSFYSNQYVNASDMARDINNSGGIDAFMEQQVINSINEKLQELNDEKIIESFTGKSFSSRLSRAQVEALDIIREEVKSID